MDSPLNIGLKKYFFNILASLVSEILSVKGYPGKKSAINNF